MSEVQELDLSARYKADGFSGVALRIAGWEQKWEPSSYLEDCNPDECDEDCDLGHWVEDGEGEWVDDIGGRVRVVMIGDDAEHLVDLEGLTELDEEGYCCSCGQIGCQWG